MTGKSAGSELDPNLLFGSCSRLDDAIFFVELKEQDGWRVILRPFPFAFSNIELKRSNGGGKARVASEFAFLLHRFYV